MIPGGDHSSRTLLFRRIRSWSDVTTGTHDDDTAIGNSNGDGDDQLLRQPLLQLNSSLSANDDNDIECDENDQVPSSPLFLPQGLSLEYEEQSQESISENGENQPIYHTIASADWKLWIVFGILVASGVGNVIFAKLQSLPM